MKKFLHSRDGAPKGAALIIVLALVVIATGVSLAYFTRTTSDRQLAQSSYHDTSADLLARSALDITVSDLKQEIAAHTPTPAPPYYIQPSRYGVPPITDPSPIPNLIRRSFSGDPTGRTSSVSSGFAAANGRSISRARWNSHYLIPRANPDTSIDSTPVTSFTVPDWVLVTAQGPTPAPSPSAVIGRYAFTVYDEGGLINMNLGGFPTYLNASLDPPTLPDRRGRKLPPKYPSEESEIMFAACQLPSFTPDHTNITIATGVPCSLLFNTNHNPTSFSIQNPPLPDGLTINTDNGNISGTATGPGQWDIYQLCSNACGVSSPAILHLTITGFPIAQTTPWPVNLARKGTVGFADLTALPAIPPVITPTTSLTLMDGFPSPAPINKLMGWRNYATTQQPVSASFDSPWFVSTPTPTPAGASTPPPDAYANYVLGAVPPFTAPYTTVPITVQNSRTDQAVMTRQELIKLQRTIGFSQNLLQYLGTFSREFNRPAQSWPGLAGSLIGARWDMNNLGLVIPQPWFYPGYHGIGHAYGKQRNADLLGLFGLVWVAASNNFVDSSIRFTDPNYYGHWKYVHTLNPATFPDNPDFFQVIDYAMTTAVGRNDPNHVRNTFTVGAALIDQYDTDDLTDAPLDGSPGNNNAITTIDYLNDETHPENYAYGIESMSFTDPHLNGIRASFAPYPAPVPITNARLNRRFENVGEFGYAFNPASTTASGTLDFASATSNDRAILDFFTYNVAGNRAGIVNLNTRNVPVIASMIRGALLHDPGYELTPTELVSPRGPSVPFPRPDDALTAAQAIVQETMNNPVLTRADVSRLAAVAAAALPTVLGVSDEKKQTIARALAEVGLARTWNVMIDVIAQTGQYAPGTQDLTDPTKFIVQGEKRYWLHIALDRDDGTVLGTQLEEVIE